MSGNTKLSSLLQYRFVKKSRGRDDTDDSQETIPPTDSDSQQTLPSIEIDSQKTIPYSQNSINTIPQTPTSEVTSPVINIKQNGRFANCISDESSEESCDNSSPWLSKDKAPLTNGFTKEGGKKSRIRRPVSDSSGSSGSEDEESERSKAPSMESVDDDNDSNGFDQKLNQLQDMFPKRRVEELLEIVKDTKTLQDAIDVVLSRDQTSSTSKKRPRESSESNESDSGDDDLPDIQPQKKRVTHLQDKIRDQITSSVSDSSMVVNSQAMEDKISFLKDAFPTYSKKVLWKILDRYSWSVENATEAIGCGNIKDIVNNEAEKRQEKKEKHREEKQQNKKKKIKSYDSGDDYNSDDADGSGDSDEEEFVGKTLKDVMLNFFNTAGLEEIVTIPQCTKKKADIIIAKRPYGDWENLVDKFCEKPLSYGLVSGCREIIHVRDVIKRLMQKCENISLEMETVIEHLKTNAHKGNKEITKQPDLLNKDLSLKSYQMVGLNWLRIMHSQKLNGILADEMGLGKTIETIAFLAHLLEVNETGPHVIIVPSSTIENWIREMELWCPALSILVYYGTQDERRYSRQQILYSDTEFNVILTTYNMATGSVDDRSLFKKVEFHYAVFDEGHMLKNMSSLRYQNLMKISASRRLLLTGTPLQNNLLELMSLLSFVMPDIFEGQSEYLKKMFSSMNKSTDEDKKQNGRSSYMDKRIAHAKRIMKPFLLRRIKTEVLKELPLKHEHVCMCSMIPNQDTTYHDKMEEFTKKIREESDTLSRAGAAMLMQLRKTANHHLLQRSIFNDSLLNEISDILAREPSHVDRGALPKFIKEDLAILSDFDIHHTCLFYPRQLKQFSIDKDTLCDSAKFRKLDELLPKFKENGDRVLLFSQFTMMMDIIEVYLKDRDHKYQRLDGSTAVTERQTMIDKYNNNPDIFIFLMSTKAGGMGINLSTANVVIIHDIDFNPYNDKQAEDRCHRMGQTKPVNVYRLITKGTVEEGMMRIAKEKLKLERDVTSNTGENEEEVADSLTLLQEALKSFGKPTS